MLLKLACITALGTMEFTPLQDRDVITAFKGEYLTNKMICSLGIIMHFKQHPKTINKTAINAIKPKTLVNNPVVSSSDEFSAISHVINNDLFLKKKFLDFEVDNQPLGDELTYLRTNLLAVEMFNEKENQVFTYILDSIKNIVILTSSYMSNTEEVDNSEKLNFLNEFLVLIAKYAETFSTDNSLVHSGTQISTGYNNKKLFSHNTKHNINRSLEHTKIPFYTTMLTTKFNNSMESMFVLLFRKHGYTEELRKLTYNYYIFTNILSSINQVFSILIIMSRLAIFNIKNNNKSDISIEQRDYLELLFNAVRECNINISLAIIDVQGIYATVTENIDRFTSENVPVSFVFNKEQRKLCVSLDQNDSIALYEPLLLNN